MKRFLGVIITSLRWFSGAERWIIPIVEGFSTIGVRILASPILRLARFLRREKTPNPASAPAPHPGVPPGPFVSPKNGEDCGLLVFVPRSLESWIVDELTGRYGYSHVAVDLGEVEAPTGKRVMVESTTHHPVERAYQDKYGIRPFIRVPLKQYGIDCSSFTSCIASRLGEQYDTLEALTWGAVDDPSRQICSNLPVNCLPETFHDQIVQQRRAGKIHARAVSIYPTAMGKERIFVSPNGFAQFFHAPKGRKISRPNKLIVMKKHRRRWLGGWPVAAAVTAGLALATLVLAHTPPHYRHFYHRQQISLR